MNDRNEHDERPPAPPSEGVRILGAEEARAAVEGGAARRRPAEPARRAEPRHHEPPRRPGEEPADRFGRDDTDTYAAVVDDEEEPEGLFDELSALRPRDDRREERESAYPDAGPTWSASEVGAEGDDAEPAEPPTGEVPPLPHWTEPPTGAVPAIFAAEGAEGEGSEDDWSALSASQPRFRAEGADWAEADFGTEELSDLSGERVGLGALAAEEAPVDEDADFAAQVEGRRRAPVRTTRTRATRPPEPRPRRPQPAEGDLVPAPSGGRDLPTALATAAILVVVALVCFSWGTTATAWLVAVVAGLASLELVNTLRPRGLRAATPVVLLGSLGIVPAAREYGSAAYPVFVLLVVVFSFLWFLWRVTPGRPLMGVATTLLAFGYVGGLTGFAGLMLQSADGVGLILGVAFCGTLADSAGFFVGSQFGKSPIAPHISPKKTVEGTVASMLTSLVVGWLVVGSIAPWTRNSGLALGALCAVAAFVGDLSESMLKRDLGIKDFGSILPGHGGILDRFDSLIFCLPVGYYLALHLNYL